MEKFWNKYREADGLKKQEIMKPIVKNILSGLELTDKKVREHAMTILLTSYFDDLINVMEQRNNIPPEKLDKMEQKWKNEKGKVFSK